MKIALISDIHSNIEALKSVLEDIEKKGIKKIYCLGDMLGYLNKPNEVVDLVRERGIESIIGNNDEDIVFENFKDDETKKWTYKALTSENIRFIKNLKKDITISVEGNKIKMVHGSPSSSREYLREGEENTQKVLLSLGEDILVVAHTHLPYIDFYNNKMIINCGSVGKPKFCSPNSSYAILSAENEEVIAEIVEVEYDVESTITSLRVNGFSEELIEDIKTGGIS